VGASIIVGEVVLQARAKLNLTLKILGQQSDGYHDLESVVQSVDLCDGITLRTEPPSPFCAGGKVHRISVKVTCNDPKIPTGRGNLALEAALALADFVGLEASAERESDPQAPCSPGVSVEIDLEKRIPVGAGLGGGSADAAAVLVGLNRLWNLGLGIEELMAVGEKLGADVPFCIKGGTAIIRGKGERVESLPTPAGLWFVVVTLPEQISTAEVYARYDQLADASGADGSRLSDNALAAADVASNMVRALSTGKAHDIALGLANDLELAAVTFVPSVSKVKDALLSAGAMGAGMSGSGPTVFGIAESREKAEEISSALKSSSASPKKPQSEEDASSCTLFQEVFVCKAVSEGVAFIFTPRSGEGGR